MARGRAGRGEAGRKDFPVHHQWLFSRGVGRQRERWTPFRDQGGCCPFPNSGVYSSDSSPRSKSHGSTWAIHFRSEWLLRTEGDRAARAARNAAQGTLCDDPSSSIRASNPAARRLCERWWHQRRQHPSISCLSLCTLFAVEGEAHSFQVGLEFGSFDVLADDGG